MQDEQNGPHPSSKNPHFQNEARCTTFLVKISFICMRMKNDFHIKDWAPTLALKQRPEKNLEMAYFAYFALCKGIQISESWKFFPESRILGFGIRKTAHGFRNQTNDWNPESKFHWQTLEFITVIRNPRRGIQNPAMTVNSLTRGLPLDLIACFIENPVPRGSITKAKGWTQIESLIS